ncbi:MAG: pyruvate kinase [Saprospiraceae bacterium]|nr:pyruvate kinase [Candidatus Opimibacter skivensis]MBL0008491.1 pyruvate kinase [Candidatus Opimibacter skivensis]
MHQNTKIVATVGPACSDYEVLLALAKEGVHVFRLNFSHGTHEEHKEVINHILRINQEHDFHVGILADLQGPKIRIGNIESKEVLLESGKEIIFTTEKCPGTAERVYISYENFPKEVKAGERILLDDGKLVLEVVSTDRQREVRLKIIFGGVLSSKKGVNLPDTALSIPCITEKDLADLDFILTQPVNWIALSFVRRAEDIIELQELIDAAGHPAKTIAKIEKPEAVRNIRKIVKQANGIMIARGDLAVEVAMEKLPTIQKDIIKLCIERSRPVIVATQLMDSMINNPSPTRAEITDVANAVLDGTDAVMLSAETSVGKHPVKVVEAMNKIIAEAEKHYSPAIQFSIPSPKSRTFWSDTVCYHAARMAQDVDAKAIIGMTTSGFTAFKISSYRPIHSKIYVFSEQNDILNTLNLVWGVQTFFYDKFTTTDETIYDCVNILLAAGKVAQGDIVINTGSMPMHKKYRTNMLKLTLVD